MNTVAYVLYYDGRARLVSQEEWEMSWLSWWKRTSYQHVPMLPGN